MKNLFYLIVLALLPMQAICQDIETILTAPDDWQHEIITFPMGFAPEIDLTGFEDLRFAPGWNDSTSQEFWTYMFVWCVEEKTEMTEEKLTNYFNSYYNGLMNIDFHNSRDSLKLDQRDKTICLFVKTTDGFLGKMRVFDRFFSNEYLILNIKVSEQFCLKTNKQIVPLRYITSSI